MVEAEFDRIADVYDSTREPATDYEVDAMVDALKGCRTVLDVGIGTGRFAKPLRDKGFEVTGVDISRKMMMKAREKGLRDVTLAEVHYLPFRDGSFDAALVVHVLHIVTDWRSMMAEVGRVTSKDIVSVLRGREGSRFSRSADPNSVGALYARLREEMGYPIQFPFRRMGRIWQNEDELRRDVPPRKVERIRDETVTTTLEETLMNRGQRRGGANQLPEDVRRKIVERIIAERGNQTYQRRLTEDLAVWDPAQFLSAGRES